MSVACLRALLSGGSDVAPVRPRPPRGRSGAALSRLRIDHEGRHHSSARSARRSSQKPACGGDRASSPGPRGPAGKAISPGASTSRCFARLTSRPAASCRTDWHCRVRLARRFHASTGTHRSPATSCRWAMPSTMRRTRRHSTTPERRSRPARSGEIACAATASLWATGTARISPSGRSRPTARRAGRSYRGRRSRPSWSGRMSRVSGAEDSLARQDPRRLRVVRNDGRSPRSRRPFAPAASGRGRDGRTRTISRRLIACYVAARRSAGAGRGARRDEAPARGTPLPPQMITGAVREGGGAATYANRDLHRRVDRLGLLPAGARERPGLAAPRRAPVPEGPTQAELVHIWQRAACAGAAGRDPGRFLRPRR